VSTPDGGGRREPGSGAADRWRRINRLWHGLFAVTLVVPTVLAQAEPDAPPRYRLFTAGLVAGFGLWYWAFLARRLHRLDRLWPVLAYWAGAIAFTVLLTGQHGAYGILVYSQYPLMFMTLGWWALAPTAGLTFLIGWRTGIWRDGSDAILDLLTTTALAWVIALFVDAVVKQSEQRREALEALERTRVELAATARHAGVLEERQRLARELHDTVAQGLISVVTQLEAAEQALSTQPEQARRHLVSARRSARAGLTEVRRSVRDLRPDLLDGASLADALGRACRTWSADVGVPAELRTTGSPAPLHPAAETALLRTAQEALANVARHASARHVTVTLSYLGDTVTLDVDDDGVGFAEPPPAAGDSGFGLAGMRERITAIGGRLDIESAPGSGTTIAASVPA
jgi:signal transduction histidine kinase